MKTKTIALLIAILFLAYTCGAIIAIVLILLTTMIRLNNEFALPASIIIESGMLVPPFVYILLEEDRLIRQQKNSDAAIYRSASFIYLISCLLLLQVINQALLLRS